MEKKKKKLYYITTYYKLYQNNELMKILGKEFIKNNRNKCKIIYKNKIYELKEYFEDIDNNYNHMDLIKFKLIFIHNIIDMSYEFYNCNSLISILVKNEISLNIPYSQIATNNKQYISYDYDFLSSSDESYVSKWDKFKINNMNKMFYGCKSLISLPNISQWNISNVNNMQNLFFGCKSLLKFPDFYIVYLDNNNNIFELTYNNKNKKGRMRILGNEFIKKNKDKGIIIYKNCIYELKEYYEDIDNSNEEKIKFILCLNKNIDDMSHIFYQCELLISINSIYIFNYNRDNNQLYEENNEVNHLSSDSILQLSYINDNKNSNSFVNILNDSNQSLSQISSNSNKTESNYFSENEKSYLQISVFAIIDINNIFFCCQSLVSLPDISNWNTSNVENMSNLFLDCNSLISIPDISKWDTSKVTTLESMFQECKSLISLPDISKWDISKVETMKYMFLRCESLILLPDISKWDTKHLSGLGYMFSECKSLISLPDLSKWAFSNNIWIDYIFYECGSLISLPDIRKWNIKGVNIIT